MINKHTFIHKLNNVSQIELKINDQVFKPTATSHFLIKASNENIKKPGTLLDLGCGIGVVGISIYLNGIITKLFSSDLSEEAIVLTEENSKLLNINIDARVGDKFECWNNLKFDYIINDVSGVSEDIAIHSEWFKNVPNNSGKGGSNHILNILKEAKNYLTNGGKLFFPIISLSNHEEILSKANQYFSNVKHLTRNEWFLPKELEDKIEILKELKANQNITYQEKFGKIVCFTDIYEAF